MPGAYVVRDANGQALVYVYSRENEAEALQAKVLTADEARRVAINVAKLPEFHQRRQAAGVPSTSPSCRSYCGAPIWGRTDDERPGRGRASLRMVPSQGD
jgi:hypothetical protein